MSFQMPGAPPPMPQSVMMEDPAPIRGQRKRRGTWNEGSPPPVADPAQVGQNPQPPQTPPEQRPADARSGGAQRRKPKTMWDQANALEQA